MYKRTSLLAAGVAILAALVAGPVRGQEAATITGRVTNEAGAPITGVTVYVDNLR